MAFANDPTNLPLVMRVPEVMAALRMGRTTLYRLLDEDPEFPKPVKLTRRAIGWRRADIEAWLASRPAADVGGAA